MTIFEEMMEIVNETGGQAFWMVNINQGPMLDEVVLNAMIAASQEHKESQQQSGM